MLGGPNHIVFGKWLRDPFRWKHRKVFADFKSWGEARVRGNIGIIFSGESAQQIDFSDRNSATCRKGTVREILWICPSSPNDGCRPPLCVLIEGAFLEREGEFS